MKIVATPTTAEDSAREERERVKIAKAVENCRAARAEAAAKQKEKAASMVTNSASMVRGTHNINHNTQLSKVGLPLVMFMQYIILVFILVP